MNLVVDYRHLDKELAKFGDGESYQAATAQKLDFDDFLDAYLETKDNQALTDLSQHLNQDSQPIDEDLGDLITRSGCISFEHISMLHPFHVFNGGLDVDDDLRITCDFYFSMDKMWTRTLQKYFRNGMKNLEEDEKYFVEHDNKNTCYVSINGTNFAQVVTANRHTHSYHFSFGKSGALPTITQSTGDIKTVIEKQIELMETFARGIYKKEHPTIPVIPSFFGDDEEHPEEYDEEYNEEFDEDDYD